MTDPTLIERLKVVAVRWKWDPDVAAVTEADTALSSPPAQMPEPRQPLTLDDDESCPFCGPGKEYDRKQAALSSPPSLDLRAQQFDGPTCSCLFDRDANSCELSGRVVWKWCYGCLTNGVRDRQRKLTAAALKESR